MFEVPNLFIDRNDHLRAGWRFFIAGILYKVVTYLASVAASALAPGGGNRSELVFRGLSLLLLVLGYAGLSVVADHNSRPLTYVGLSFGQRQIKEVVFGLGFGAAQIGMCVAGIALAGALTLDIRLRSGMVRLVVVQLVILAVAAMLEEVVFRGYPFQRLAEAVGAIPAILILAALFGAGHLNNPSANLFGILNTMLIGVLFCIAYLRTRSLWLSWAIHFSWNLTLGVVFGLPVSGLTQFAVVVRGRAEGPTWLTGGSYGIEAAATATVAIVLGILVLFLIKAPTMEVPAIEVPDVRSAGQGSDEEVPRAKLEP